jgi:S1/P1 Nuclease
MILRRLAALLLILAAAPAHAWSNQGHMATGAMAYDTLAARDPAAVAAIVAIMAAHPDRLRFDRDLKGLKGEMRTRVLFEQMARWPDDIRNTSYDRPEWHYNARIVSGWTALWVKVGKADAAFAGSMQVLRDPAVSPRAKAVALCWLFHITGDMHQPLHAGHRASFRFPLTDRLGTIAWVKRPGEAEATDMHQLWDKALDRPAKNPVEERFGAEAIAASADIPGLPAAWTIAGRRDDFARWFDESRNLARDIGYAAPVLGATRDAAAAPTLTQGYVQQLDNIARLRVALAGRRLGNLLSTILGSGASRPAR